MTVKLENVNFYFQGIAKSSYANNTCSVVSDALCF